MTVRDDATERQVQAADPYATTWVAANAGSGKTRVLTDRVARLLLRGVEPQRILCLTYTKAAATEMQNRLFKRLGAWSMKPDADLQKQLADLGEPPAKGRDDLARARRLFARALETPGGLRIQTIHSFCATLLRRFPLEAGVSPGFTELDDRAARLLRAQIVEEMAQSRAPEVMAEIARIYTGEDFTQLMEQVANNRHGFAAPLSETAAKAALGVDPATTEDDILSQVLPRDLAALVASSVPHLLAGGKTDAVLAAALAAIDPEASDREIFAALADACLTKNGTAKKNLPTSGVSKVLGDVADELRALFADIETANESFLALSAARKTLALHRFAHAFLPLYRDAKSRRGWLDFDDLISHAKDLLTDSAVAAWVLYRLDGGIDHILVDEAQDTSPDQWRVIELLAAEFTAGQGTQDDKVRTLFVVGDKKQSIYSFQGADVAAFDAKRLHFKDKFEAARQQFQDQELQHSFRSAPAILQLVDSTFADMFPRALGQGIHHMPFRADQPGRVDLWPLIDPVKPDEDGEWENPVDLVAETHHTAQLADQIAQTIAEMIATSVQIKDEKGIVRPVHEGDFLILVQRRSALFAEIIRACKQARLAIAGADRLKLGAELAVKDLAALLSFLATPEDSLSLAALLRSPLCGWTEDELYRLANGHSGFLWEALRKSDGHGDTLDMLRDLLDQADFLRPFDLIERALTRHDGRRRLLTRLGDEAEDGIDELLSQALAYENNDVPSLTGFLIWLETDDITIKRQMDSAGRRIRVMTVHGAKGLEAPIVILPDTADRNPRDRDEIYRLPDGLPVWKTPAEASPEVIRATRAQRKSDQEAESARLLYVALTRPQSWLIVAGAGEAKTERKDNNKTTPKELTEWPWYRLVEKAMLSLGAKDMGGGRLRLSNGDWPTAGTPADKQDLRISALPDWTLQPAEIVPHPPKPFSPSDLGGAKALAGEAAQLTEDQAKARGTALHLLMEHLPSAPAEDRRKIAEALIHDPLLRADILGEVEGVLSNPDLSWVFGPDALTEVTLSAPLGQGRLLGTIDRLVLRPDRVIVVDFKSNAIVPASAAEVPEGLLRQMGAYEAALAQIYPGHEIQSAILWTRNATLMPLDRDIVSAALARAAIP